MIGAYFPQDNNPFNHFMDCDEVDNNFTHNIDKVISYLIKNTHVNLYDAHNHKSLLSAFYYHFRQMRRVNMSRYNTWRFEYNRIYFTMTTELPNRIIIAAINNDDHITHVEKWLLECIVDRYNITINGYQVENLNVIVLDKVPFSCYYPILKLFTPDEVKKEPPRVDIIYFPTVYKKTPFQWLHSYYVTLLELTVYNMWGKCFDELQITDLRERVTGLNTEFRKLCVNLSCYNITDYDADKIIGFFKYVRTLERIRQYCFASYYKDARFKVSVLHGKPKVKLVIETLMDRVPHLFQWLMTHSKTFENCKPVLAEIKRDKEEKERRKHLRKMYSKTSGDDINHSIANIYTESFSPIYTGDKDLDAILRDVTAPSINDLYNFCL